MHLQNSDRFWLRTVTKGSVPRLDAADFPTGESLRPAVHALVDGWRAALAAETDSERAIVAQWPSRDFPTTFGTIVQHMVNHGAYHRGQVTTLLHQVGAPGITTDLLVYHDRR